MYQQLKALELIDRMPGLLNNGWGVSSDTGLITPMGPVCIDLSKNWVYVNPGPDMRCNVYQEIVSGFGFIPSRCMNCWKVVAKPYTLHQLVQIHTKLLGFTKDYIGTGRFCKCGMEDRPFVPQNYGAYFYTGSLLEGRKRWTEVRAMMDDIPEPGEPEIPVTLKRYCTEFEMMLGPSDEYKRPEWADNMEKRIFDNMCPENQMPVNTTQPMMMVQHVFKRWIEFAWSIGDETAVAYNDDKPLYRPCVTYHPTTGEGELKDEQR